MYQIKKNMKQIVLVVLPLIIALVCIFKISGYASSAEFHEQTIKALDDKKTTVMELTAASTAASAAITLIPGDTATPIAEKLADFSSYFLIVLCAIYLEKYLVTITGYAAFTILIPIACVFFSVYMLSKKHVWKQLAIKLALFGTAIVLVIPASVKVSNLIENTYESSIESTIEAAEQTTGEIEEGTEEDSGFFSKVKDGVANITAKAENVLNNFIEALAVMLVTSCGIPIIVLVFFVWLVKVLLGVDVNVPMSVPTNFPTKKKMV